MRFLQYFRPDYLGNIVADTFNSLLYVAAILLDFRPDEFHDGIALFLACFEEQSWRHLVNQRTQIFDLTPIFLVLNRDDGFLEFEEQVSRQGLQLLRLLGQQLGQLVSTWGLAGARNLRL